MAKAVLTDSKEQWLTETFLKDMANTLAIVFPLKKFADDHNCSSEQVNWALIEFTGRPLVKLAQFVHENPQRLSVTEYSRKVSESCMESLTKQYCSSVFSTPKSVKSTVGQKIRFCSASQVASSNSDEDSRAQLKTPPSIVHTNESKTLFKNTSQPVTAAENMDDAGQGNSVDLHGTLLASSMTGASLIAQSGTTSTDEESPMSVKAVTGFTEKEKRSNLKIRFKLNPPKRPCPVSNANSNDELPKSPLDRVTEKKRTKTL